MRERGRERKEKGKKEQKDEGRRVEIDRKHKETRKERKTLRYNDGKNSSERDKWRREK